MRSSSSPLVNGLASITLREHNKMRIHCAASFIVWVCLVVESDNMCRFRLVTRFVEERLCVVEVVQGFGDPCLLHGIASSRRLWPLFRPPRCDGISRVPRLMLAWRLVPSIVLALSGGPKKNQIHFSWWFHRHAQDTERGGIWKFITSF